MTLWHLQWQPLTYFSHGHTRDSSNCMNTILRTSAISSKWLKSIELSRTIISNYCVTCRHNIQFDPFGINDGKWIWDITTKKHNWPNRINLTVAVTFVRTIHTADIIICTISLLSCTRRKFTSSPTHVDISILKTTLFSNTFVKGEASWKITGQSQKLNSAGAKFITLSLAFYQFVVRSLSRAVVACNGIVVINGERNFFCFFLFSLVFFRQGDCPNVGFRPWSFIFFCALGEKNFIHSHLLFQWLSPIQTSKIPSPNAFVPHQSFVLRQFLDKQQ